MGQSFRAEALKNVEHEYSPLSTHLQDTVSKKRGTTMKELENPHHTVNLGEFSGFSVFIRGFDFTLMRQLKLITSAWSEILASSVH
ncbi:hypothetical protein TNCT_182351 [Trichonephila clavata]|uniref:Uncharacterized protein n=1 Tax=Trichonephila clavata TaxID=2740835 RepID=A0A8X6KU06_TRICU|nr:hypothetical protein TNCT_182351 [Trichonephila clavata]